MDYPVDLGLILEELFESHYPVLLAKHAHPLYHGACDLILNVLILVAHLLALRLRKALLKTILSKEGSWPPPMFSRGI